MDHIRVQEECEQPLLRERVSDGDGEEKAASKTKTKTKTQKAVRKTFKGTAHLSSLLPTGSVLIFEFLCPIFTNKGRCRSLKNQLLTIALLSFCCISCFVMRFTDSIRDDKGKLRYGFITFKGIWIADGTLTLPPQEAAEYRIRFRDCFHAFLSVLVFMVVALFDQNVIACFYPAPSDEFKDMLVNAPALVGILCIFFFLVFPSKRHAASAKC
ncbi:hypothetical protein Dimus_009540 [Dionaea muscipula]